MRRIVRRARRLWEILSAFLVMGYRAAIAYPANLAMGQVVQPLLQIIVFYFVAKLVGPSGPSTGGDYFTFVVIGWATIQILQAGLGSLSFELRFAVQQGRFEMFLVEPCLLYTSPSPRDS